MAGSQALTAFPRFSLGLRLEVATAVLLAVTTLATVWCSYQSSRWNSRTAALADRAVKLERRATVLYLEGNQATQMQGIMFMQHINAKLGRDARLARWYADRFPGELRAAHETWLSQRPFENPRAAPHPLVPGLYEPRNAREVRELTAESARLTERAREHGTVAAQYLNGTVVFAIVLFFAGTSARFTSRRVQVASFVFAGLLLAFTIARVAFLPVGF